MGLESRVELILQNILGASNEVDPESRVEKLLQNLIEAAYIVDPMSRVELLLENLQGGSNDVVPMSRVEMLIANALGESYDVVPMSRVEELLVLLAEEYAAVYKTVTGSVVTFDDAIPNKPIKSLLVDIPPIQDLHGYDSPWVDGGGKNLLNPNNIFGASAYYTINSDGSITVLKYNGTAWNNYVNFPISLEAGTYTVSRSAAYGALTIRKASDNYGENVCRLSNGITSGSFTLDSDDVIRIKFNSGNDVTYPNTSFFQLEKGESATAWTPYENICPISGWTGVNLRHTNENLWDDAWYSLGDDMSLITDTSSDFYGYYTGAVRAWANAQTANGNENLFPDGVDNLKITADLGNMSSSSSFTFCFWFFYTDGTSGYQNNITVNELSKVTVTKTSTAGKKCTGFWISTSAGVTNRQGCVKNVMVTIDETTEFVEPVQNPLIPISWQTEAGTVYGGTLDVLSGVMRAEYQCIKIKDASNFSKSGVAFRMEVDRKTDTVYPRSDAYKTVAPSQSTVAEYCISCHRYGTYADNYRKIVYINDPRYATVEEFVEAMGEHQILFELNTPIEIQLAPHELTTLLGQNNIWADTGDVTVEYLALKDGGD